MQNELYPCHIYREDRAFLPCGQLIIQNAITLYILLDKIQLFALSTTNSTNCTIYVTCLKARQSFFTLTFSLYTAAQFITQITQVTSPKRSIPINTTDSSSIHHRCLLSDKWTDERMNGQDYSIALHSIAQHSKAQHRKGISDRNQQANVV